LEILHRISIDSKKDAEFMAAILNFGIEHTTVELPGGESNLITFVISESDLRWTTIRKLLKIQLGNDIYKAGGQYETTFSEHEIRSAKWLRLIPSFEQGYPQPQSQWPLKQMSYENVCPQCGIYIQTKNLRLKKEPSLGKNSFMSLIWANEVFCTSDVLVGLETIGAIGYSPWDAIIHKTGQPSKIIHQLFVPRIALPGLVIDKYLKWVVCSTCGIKKYYPHWRGIMYLRKEAMVSEIDFILTNEWFGSGLIAFRELLVSNRVATLIIDKGWQGVRFKVVELT
jgi:hypothetical protein